MKLDQIDRKLAHASSMQSRAVTRVHRASTILKSWTAKRRYYERQAAKIRTKRNLQTRTRNRKIELE
jgi:hypothetical protein